MQYKAEAIAELIRKQYNIEPKTPIVVVNDFNQPTPKGVQCYFSVSFKKEKQHHDISLLVTEEGHYVNEVTEVTEG